MKSESSKVGKTQRRGPVIPSDHHNYGDRTFLTRNPQRRLKSVQPGRRKIEIDFLSSMSLAEDDAQLTRSIFYSASSLLEDDAGHSESFAILCVCFPHFAIQVTQRPQKTHAEFYVSIIRGFPTRPGMTFRFGDLFS